MSQPLPEQAPPGLVVGDWTVTARLGQGGMGVVHLARSSSGERAALKVIRPHIVGDDEARARLAREVGSLRRVRSRRVAEVVDADPWGPVPFVATRYVPGLTLDEEVAREGPIAGEDLRWFAACLAEALAAVHEAGVLHRDVKPSNVIMEGRSPVLIDFGLARVADDPKITMTGWLLGTPGYLAPEILHGEDATTAADVHSYAATVAFAATGRPPFGTGPSMAIMDRVRRGEFRLDGVEPPMRDILAACLQPDPVLRPRLASVRAWLDGTARPPGAPAREVAPRPEPPPAPATLPLVAGLPPREAVSDPTRVETQHTTQHTTPHTTPSAGPHPGAGEHRARPDAAWPPPSSEPETPRSAPGSRPRRALVLLAGLATVSAAIAAFPWLTVGGLVGVVWLLRSASLTASAAGDRRRLRGSRWYDGPQLVASSPWHLLAGLGGTVLLVLWSGGLGLAAALLCFAAGAPVSWSLAGVGAVFVASVWWGPGGGRVRRPVGRLLRPVADTPSSWALATALLLVGALVLWLKASTGADWAPAGGPPWSGLSDLAARKPDWLPF